MNVLEQLQQLSDYEEIQKLNENYVNFVSLVHDALEAETGGEVGSDDVDATIGQAIEDHAQNQLDIFDIEVQVEFEPETSGFGAMLADLIDASYDDPDEGIAVVSEVAMITPEEVQAYLMGQAAPSPEVTEAIANHFLADDEAGYQQFLLMGQEAYQEAMSDVEMNAEVAERAEFNSILVEREVGFRLRQLEKVADQLEEQNILTPAERNSLLRSANFSKDEDSVAVFSQFCVDNGTDPNTYLDHVSFCLNWKAQAGPSNYSAFFSQEVVETIDPEAGDRQQNQEFVTDYRSRHGYQ